MRALLRLLAFLALCVPAWAGAPAPSPGAPLTLPAVQTELGKPSPTKPVVFLCAGQSNAVGQDATGPKNPNLTNVYAVDSFEATPTLRPAAFGTAPFNRTTPSNSSTTTDPNAAFNNQCLWAAGLLRASGRLDASTTIVVVGNFFPGQSISQWIGSTPGTFTAGPYFTNLQAGMNAVLAVYPQATATFMMWDQGENDTTGTYGSQALYTQAFQTFLAALRTQSWWSPLANVTMVEMARFSDNVTQTRNDAIDAFACGAIDPHVTATSTLGATETVVAGYTGPHYSGVSLAGLLASQDYANYVQGSLGGGYRCQPPVNTNPTALSVTTGNTIQVTPDQARMSLTITAGGGTINLPDPTSVGAGTIIFINSLPSTTTNLSCSSGSTTSPCGGGVTTDNTLATTAPTIAVSAVSVLYVSNAKWYLTTLAPKTGGFVFRVVSQTANASVALDNTTLVNTRGSLNLLNGNTITLPAPSSGQWVGFYGNPAGAVSTITTVDGSSTIRKNNGQLVATITVQPGEMVWMTSISGVFALMSDNVTTASVTEGVTAAGTNLATATALASDVNTIATCTSGGVSLRAYIVGLPQEVFNASANTCNLYPPSASTQLWKAGTTIGVGVADTIAAGAHVKVIPVNSTLAREAP